MADETRVLSMDEAMALMDKHAAEDKAKAEAGKKKKEKAKDALKAGAAQGLKGLGIHTKKLLDEIED